MNDGKEPPRPVKSIMMLPYDLLLNCLARVSRSHYPTLLLVYKTLHSLLASTDLYQTRTLLGRTESCLYLRLLGTEPNWFILSGRAFVPISSPNSGSLSGTVAVVGPNIYAIGGGGSGNEASSRVMFMDTRSHTWREAPSMRVVRVLPSACTLDGKIYVAGGCDNLNPRNWMEVFDTKTQTWEFLQIPSDEICGGSEYKSLSFEGSLFLKSEAKNATYKLHEGRWRATDMVVDRGMIASVLPSSFCVIKKVLYSIHMKLNREYKFDWYEPKKRVCKTLRGLKGAVPRNLGCDVKLADHGGEMAILWKERTEPIRRKERTDEKELIWCSVITLEKRQDGKIRGKPKWPKGYEIVLMANVSAGGLLVDTLTSTVW